MITKPMLSCLTKRENIVMSMVMAGLSVVEIVKSGKVVALNKAHKPVCAQQVYNIRKKAVGKMQRFLAND